MKKYFIAYAGKPNRFSTKPNWGFTVLELEKIENEADLLLARQKLIENNKFEEVIIINIIPLPI